MANRYSGLVKIAYADPTQRKALLQGWQNFTEAHPLGSMAMYMLPGVGTVASGVDAINAFSQGRVAAGLGHTLFAGAGLFGGAGLLRFLGRAGKIARGAELVKPGLVARATQAASHIPGIGRLAPYSSKFNGWYEALKPVGGFKPVAAGAGLSMFGAPPVPQTPQIAYRQPIPYHGHPYARQMYTASNPYARQLYNYA